MQKSESIKSIAKSLSVFQSEMPTVSLDREVTVKTKAGGEYRFSYATFRNIIETAKPLLAKNNLSFSQLVETDGTVTTILMHESGEWLSSSLHITGEQTAQGIGSAITYAKRYSLSSILGIVADDDDDANITEGNTFTTEKKEAKPWLNKNTPQWTEAIKFLSGGGSITKIEGKYSINKKNREELLTSAI
jgi:hypothetical protein